MSIGKRILKMVAWIVGIALLLVLFLVAYVQMRWDAKDARPAPDLKARTDSASIARGEYIYRYTAQCWGCHETPHGGQNPQQAGGRLFDLTETGPGFGKWYSRNLTPDVESGLGGWTDGEIVRALREGLRKDGTTLFPIMPIDWYHGMSDDDVLAVVAYLRSFQPVKNTVPEREPSFFAKALFTFKMIAPKEQILTPIATPHRGITPEYGRYVSSQIADCADCHTPRNLQDGAFYMDSLFAGSSFAYGDEAGEPLVSFARNITPDVETGIGAWTKDQFIEAVTTGMRPDGTVLTTHMPYAYYKFWNMDDLEAVYAYLKTLPAMKRTVPPTAMSSQLAASEGVEHGKLLFAGRCQACHGENASGAQPTNVKLAEVSASLSDQDLQEFIAGGQMNLKMPAFGKTLKPDEITDIVAFIRTVEVK